MKTITREANEEYGVSLDKKDCKRIATYETSYGSTAVVFMCQLAEKPDIVMNEGANFKWVTLEEIKDIDLGFEQDKIISDIESNL